MKATTALVALAVMGVLLQANGFSTVGGSLLSKVSPLSKNYTAVISIGATTILAFGMLMLGTSIPTRALAVLLLGLVTAPTSILTNSAFSTPVEIQIIMGIIWIGLLIQAVVGALGGDV